MKKVWIFSYGSNMNIKDMKGWLKSYKFKEIDNLIDEMKTTGTIAVLRNHRIVFNHISRGRGGGTCNFEECDGDDIYGVAYHISERFIEVLDKKEGYPTSHTRELFQIALLKGKNNEEYVSAWIYYATPDKINKTLRPTKRYKNVVITGARNWGLPPEYIKKLENISTLDR
ncbi:MAG: gamma-glutamylcyclotransferase family protein [bacterium]